MRVINIHSNKHEVSLIHVTSGTPTETIISKPQDILCFDIHDFGTEETFSWIKEYKKIVRYPVIAILINPEEFSLEIYAKISKNADDLGCLLYDYWPDECVSFKEALNKLSDGVMRNLT